MRSCIVAVAPETPPWGKPYGHRPWMTLRRRRVWMYRKRQAVRFYDSRGRQVGPEQTNVAPAVAYAMSKRWVQL